MTPEQIEEWRMSLWNSFVNPEWTPNTGAGQRQQNEIERNALCDMALAYPRLITMVQRYLDTSAKPLGFSELADIDEDARALLRELGESQDTPEVK